MPKSASSFFLTLSLPPPPSSFLRPLFLSLSLHSVFRSFRLRLTSQFYSVLRPLPSTLAVASSDRSLLLSYRCILFARAWHLEPITQIGLYGRTMEAAPVHVLGNPIGNRSIAVSRCPNCAASFNDIDTPRFDSIRSLHRCFRTLSSGKNYGIRDDRAGYPTNAKNFRYLINPWKL